MILEWLGRKISYTTCLRETCKETLPSVLPLFPSGLVELVESSVKSLPARVARGVVTICEMILRSLECESLLWLWIPFPRCFVWWKVKQRFFFSLFYIRIYVIWMYKVGITKLLIDFLENTIHINFISFLDLMK